MEIAKADFFLSLWDKNSRGELGTEELQRSSNTTYANIQNESGHLNAEMRLAMLNYYK